MPEFKVTRWWWWWSVGRSTVGRITGKPVQAPIGSMQMWVHVGNTAATKVVYGSPPDWNEMQAWRHRLHPGDLFIDVGDNVGAYSLWAAHLGCRAIAVEPDPRSCKRLAANVALNPEAEIEIVQAALTDHVGTAEITVGRDAMNSLGPVAPFRR